MFDNSHEPLDEASMLKDVRGLPLDDLLAAGSADLDDALSRCFKGCRRRRRISPLSAAFRDLRPAQVGGGSMSHSARLPRLASTASGWSGPRISLNATIVSSSSA